MYPYDTYIIIESLEHQHDFPRVWRLSSPRPSTVSPTTTDEIFLVVWAGPDADFKQYCEPPLSILVGLEDLGCMVIIIVFISECLFPWAMATGNCTMSKHTRLSDICLIMNSFPRFCPLPFPLRSSICLGHVGEFLARAWIAQHCFVCKE